MGFMAGIHFKKVGPVICASELCGTRKREGKGAAVGLDRFKGKQTESRWGAKCEMRNAELLEMRN